jgi:hypothetical protein
MMKRVLLMVVGMIWIFLLGCAGPMVQKEIGAFSRDARATLFFNQLDMTVEKYGVSDASGFVVPGFPYLRSNRFLAAMKERLAYPDAGVYWADQMLKLDLKSRRKEFSNLPAAALMEISTATGETVDRDTIYQKTESYALRLFRNDRTHPGFMDILKKTVTVPDEYSSMARVVGLYPLAGIPVTLGTAMAYSRYQEWHRTPLKDLDTDGRMVRFFHEEPDSAVDPALMKRLFDPQHLDVFDLPVLTELDEQYLASRFAPTIYQDVAKDYDRIGKIIWQDNQVRVDPGQPTAYYYTSFSFLGGHPVLQMNYAFWYSERAGRNAPWIERGPLDGLSYRVTLDRTGEPLMADIMNSCGCYYFFVPQKDIIAKVVTRPGEIAPLVPAWLPAEFPGKQMNLRVSSGWHQVQKIFVDDGSAPGIAYSLIPYEALESLPNEAGQRESVFSPAGIMKNSWRIEPYIFFSMGIHSIGYMRQRGHHAIKMIGRGHFTDPDLYDSSFLFKDAIKEP